MNSTILIVEDNQVYALLLADVLTDAGYQASIVGDGAAALKRIAANPPALVLLDLMLPGLSGRDILIRLRQTNFPDLPIVIISANPRAEALRADGATDVLIKPIDFDALLTCVAKHLQP